MYLSSKLHNLIDDMFWKHEAPDNLNPQIQVLVYNQNQS